MLPCFLSVVRALLEVRTKCQTDGHLQGGSDHVWQLLAQESGVRLCNLDQVFEHLLSSGLLTSIQHFGNSPKDGWNGALRKRQGSAT